MIRWNNDYNRGAHPAVWEALAKHNEESYGGYGLDDCCKKAAAEIKKYLGDVNADIHFLVGGTQVNYTVIASALRPYQGVISASTGHIHAHETGAVEHIGHKIHILKGNEGKLSASQIEAEAYAYETSDIPEHVTQPKMVYLSHPTEFGTLYSRQELEEIHKVCKKYGLYLFLDGARLGYGLGSEKSDMTLADIAALVDVFYIGGTKCGAAFGEAVVILNDELKPHFRSNIKQNGGMLAKGFLLGIQFYTLFKDGLYFEITMQADKAAIQIKKAFAAKGIPFYMESFTNQQFVIVDGVQMEKLKKNHIFEYQMKLEDGRHCVRFCTSWATKKEDVEALISDIEKL